MKSICNRFGFVALGLAAVVVTGSAMGQAGAVVAWGENGNGQCTVPASAQSGVTAIAGGQDHAIALKNGVVLVWGWNGNGQNNPPASAQSGVSAIAGGGIHNIALKNGEVLAWGYNGHGECNIPDSAKSGVSAIAGGYYHTIALKDGGVLAWGYNAEGQCTIPASANSGVTAIAGGDQHTIALKGGSVLAWGLNDNGQCTIPDSAKSGVTAIAGGGDHAVALKDGAVLVWGNPNGQYNPPASAQSGVSAIAAGRSHTIALKGGVVFAWGRNDSGQCRGTDGSGNPITSLISDGTVPVQINGGTLSGVDAIAGICYYSMALKGPISTITGVLPISGPSSGNTNITITGTRFFNPSTVTIGGAPATNVVVVSDTQITATTPAGFPGPAVVKVGLGSSTAFYYRPSCGSDLDNNGVVDSADLGIVLGDFGNCYESLTTPQEQEPLIFQTFETLSPLLLNKK